MDGYSTPLKSLDVIVIWDVGFREISRYLRQIFRAERYVFNAELTYHSRYQNACAPLRVMSIDNRVRSHLGRGFR